MEAKLAFELSGHQNPIFAASLSQKPGILFTAGNDKGLVEWSLAKQQFIKVMFPVRASVYAICCPEGLPLMITGLRSGEVLVFNFIEQKVVMQLRHHTKSVFDIKYLAHKKELLIASEDGTVSIWDINKLNLLHVLKVSADTVRSIAISPDNKLMALGCRDNIVRIYHTEDYSSVAELTGHTMAVFTTEFNNTGQYILSGARDAQIKIWDVNTFEPVKNIPAHLFAINHIMQHPTRPYFASASMDKSIKIWGSDDFKLYKIISREKGYPSHHLSVNKLAWNGDQLISVGDDKLVKVWDIGF
ncbi:WD40 repeat domain-containing protein [Mucilaginibacter ginkgonis]|uniref:WD40 repeat domain-containing protein n=1 Tax=Mucilaginibacter ginkgonis TaxID=2682091 RepID=A0A6I4HVT9_9SPHI|nr:WD40 repeat domain-containing protein [Mucilaginibacter ginkgonis]QQL51027.1 WD40 repeat domain-containing protein [Mucilaginibacter ginkgonis]